MDRKDMFEAILPIGSKVVIRDKEWTVESIDPGLIGALVYVIDEHGRKDCYDFDFTIRATRSSCDLKKRC